MSPAASAASRNGAGSVASRGDGVSFAASDGTRSDAEESSSEASYAATGVHRLLADPHVVDADERIIQVL
jgi:hypothetical protein